MQCVKCILYYKKCYTHRAKTIKTTYYYKVLEVPTRPDIKFQLSSLQYIIKNFDIAYFDISNTISNTKFSGLYIWLEILSRNIYKTKENTYKISQGSKYRKYVT